jgi:hypothetical protein
MHDRLDDRARHVLRLADAGRKQPFDTVEHFKPLWVGRNAG